MLLPLLALAGIILYGTTRAARVPPPAAESPYEQIDIGPAQPRERVPAPPPVSEVAPPPAPTVAPPPAPADTSRPAPAPTPSMPRL